MTAAHRFVALIMAISLGLLVALQLDRTPLGTWSSSAAAWPASAPEMRLVPRVDAPINRSPASVIADDADESEIRDEPVMLFEPVDLPDDPLPAHEEVPPIPLGEAELVLEVTPEHFGYRVRGTASDERFNDGDLIVGINGMPIEPSAAGSELLLAAIMNPGSLLLVERSEGLVSPAD